MTAQVARDVPAVMRAGVYRERGRIDVEERAVPAPGPGEVLVRISHCGVCGTDLHMVMDGWGRPGSVLGHEYAGEVAWLGAGVSGLAPGDRVIGRPAPACGRCEYCGAGRPGLCVERGAVGVDGFEGAFAEYTRVRADAVLRVPDALSMRAAALCEPLAVALHGITRSGIAAGESALVSGAGPIGALVVAALRARGGDDVRVCEPRAPRRRLAATLGARACVGPDALEVPALPFTLVRDPVHHVFECSGHREAVEAALAQLRRGGTLVLTGSGLGRPRLDAMRVLLNELHVTGAFEYDAQGFEDALSLLTSGAVEAERVLEPGEATLEGLGDVMARLAGGTTAGKVLVAPGRS